MPRKVWFPLRALRVLRFLVVCFGLGTTLNAHDLEKTQVTIVFAHDGSFVADVSNDPNWLKLRLESIPGNFADRVVFWVDSGEIRPDSVQFIPGALATYRLRGHLPMKAQTLRWFYGLVIDPYPLTVRRADGRIIVEEVQGDAWSRTIDVSGQFNGQAISGRVAGVAIAALLLVPLVLRITTKITKTRKTRNQIFFFVCFVPFLIVSCVSWLRLG